MDWAAGDSVASLLRGDAESIVSLRRFTWRGARPDSDPNRAPAVKSVSEAVERIKRIQEFVESNEPRGRHDGVACFNQVLHVVATRLLEGLRYGYFSNETFVADFTVRLANRYFEVLRTDQLEPESNPAAWRALLCRRDNPDIPAILFSTGGLNALMNYDVPVALFEASYRRRFDRHLAAKQDDYLKITGLIVEEVDEMREQFCTSLIRAIEPDVFDQVHAALQSWSVREAQNAAWRNAQLLKRLRDHRVDKAGFLSRLDGLVGMSNSLLLKPAC